MKLGLTLFACLALALSAQETTREASNELAARNGELLRKGALPGQILWSGQGESSAAEATEIASMVNDGPVGNRLGSVETFIARNPESGWVPSLRANLALTYHDQGRHTPALDHWMEAWLKLRTDKSPGAKRTLEFVLAKWVRLLASLGRLEMLSALHDEYAGMTFENPAYQVEFQTGMEAMTIMAGDPGRSYRCGPLALLNVAKKLGKENIGQHPGRYDNKSVPGNSALLAYWQSETNGFSMKQLMDANERIGLGLVAARRIQGKQLVAPSVIHWRQNHYAALLEIRGKQCLIEDPTSGTHGQWVPISVVNQEASGDFMVPKDSLPEGWALLSGEVAETIRGQGLFVGMNDDNDDFNPECRRCGSGMPYWWFSEPYINLWMMDSPVSWTTSNGEEMSFMLTYKQREMRRYPSYDYPSLPISKWNHNWLKWVELEDTEDYPPVVGVDVMNSTNLCRGNFTLDTDPDGSPVCFYPSGQTVLGTYYPTTNAPSGYPGVSIIRHLTNGVLNGVLEGISIKCDDFCQEPSPCKHWRYYGYDVSINDPTNLFKNWQATLNAAEGGKFTFSGVGTSTVYSPRDKMSAQMTFGGNPVKSFTVNYPDGSKDVFGQVIRKVNTGENGERFKAMAFITESSGPDGRTTRYIYETNSIVRLKYLEDPDGRRATLTYHSTYPNLVTQVTDPYGRTAKMEYYGDGSLYRIIDAINLTNSVAYSGNFITNLTTPYGTTTFTLTEQYDARTNGVPINHVVNRAILAQEPGGAKQMAAYVDGSTTWVRAPDEVGGSTIDPDYVPVGTPIDTFSPGGGPMAHDGTETYNSFFWGRKQASSLSTTVVTGLSESDVLKARRKHWLADEGALSISDSVSYEVGPSPDGVQFGPITWFDYPGKPTFGGDIVPSVVGTDRMPAVVAQRIPGGETSYMWYKRNSLGLPTEIISTYTATNGAVATRTNKIGYTNNVFANRIEGPFGSLEVTAGYNANNQIAWITNAPGSSLQTVTEFQYDSTTRRLTLVRNHATRLNQSLIWGGGTNGAVGEMRIWKDNGSGTFVEGYATNYYTWTNGLVLNHTNSLGLVRTLTWDGLDRLRKVAYPDGTYETNGYTALDLTYRADRLGAVNRFVYDGLRNLVFHTNELGRVTTLNRCSCGLVESVVDPLQQTTSYSYDNAGRRLATYSPGKAPVTYQYDHFNRLKQIVGDMGAYELTYNNQGLVKQVDGPAGKLSTTIFDHKNRPQWQTDRNGVTLVTSYDAFDRVRTMTWPDTGVESWGYTAGYSSATTYTNQLGKVISYLFDPLQRTTDEWVSGLYTNKFAYNPLSQLRQLTDGKGNITRWSFDGYGRTLSKTNAGGQLVWTNNYDAAGRLIAHWTPAKGLIRFGYDAAGNRIGITNPSSPSIVFAYDALNRATNMTDAVGTTSFGFTPFGALAFEDGPWSSDRVSYSYNPSGMLSGVNLQQASGEWNQTYAYDDANRLAKIMSPAGAFLYEYATISGWSPSRIARVKIPIGGSIDYGYNTAGRRQSTRLVNATSTVLNRHDYLLNLAGLPTRVTNTAGNTWEYTYDDSNQIKTAIGKESGGGSRLHEQFDYKYDAAGNLTNRADNALQLNLSVNSNNELTGVTRSGTLTVGGSATAASSSVTINGSSATLYSDNSFARASHTLSAGANTFTAIGTQTGTGTKDTNVSTINLPSSVPYGYDLNGNLVWDGQKAFGYDDQNQLTLINSGGQWKSEFTYDGLRRRRITKEYTWSDPGVTAMITNGAITAPLRNNFSGWVGGVITVGSSPVVITEVGRWKVSGNTGSHLVKLVRANDSKDVPGGSATVNMSGGTAGQFVYAALASPVTLDAYASYYLVSLETSSGDTWYDLNQPVTAGSGISVSAPVWGTGSSFTFYSGSTSYGPVGLKGAAGAWTLASETRYIYRGMQVIQERNSSNAPLVSYTRGLDLAGTLGAAGGIGGLLAHTTHGSPNVHHYYHSDGNGNITAMVNSQGQLSAKYSYDPYGNLLGISGPMAELNRYRFSSKEWHAKSGLYSYGYRFYDPYHQRWLNRDPMGEAGGINLYGFCGNLPNGMVDPDGRSAAAFGAGIGALAGGLMAGWLNDWDPECILNGMVSGGVFGLVFGATFNPQIAAVAVGGELGAAFGLGGLAGLYSGLADQAMRGCRELDLGDLIRSTLGGAAGAGLGNLFGRALGSILDDLANAIDDVERGGANVIDDITRAAENTADDAAVPPQYGPFHRVDSTSQTDEAAALMEASGELWGQGPRDMMGGRGIPAAKAWEGPLPPGKRGIEFTTPVKPASGQAPGHANWPKGHKGVIDIDVDWVKIPINVIKNTQKPQPQIETY